MKHSLVVQTLCIAGLVLTGGCARKAPQSQPAVAAPTLDTIPVTTIIVQPRSFVEFGEYYGAVSGIQEVNLIAYGGGKVEKVFVKEGASVNAGDTLAHVDAEKAATLFEMALLNERIALENFQQAQKNLSDGTMSQLSVNQLNLAYLTAKQQRIDAQRNREGALCIAPFAGIVTARRIEPYQDLPPGNPTFTLAQVRQMKVVINIPEGDIAGVREGNDATISFSALPDANFSGKVYRVTRAASDMTKAFTAEIHLDNPKSAIKPGFTARVLLARRTLNNQIVVPTRAVLSKNEESFVMVAHDNRAVRASVVLGPTNRNESVIVRGLAPASALVVEGSHLLVDGSPLRIINPH